jgi:hypothetical protein
VAQDGSTAIDFRDLWFKSRCGNECLCLVFVVKAAASAVGLSLVPRRTAGCVCNTDLNQGAACTPDGLLRHSDKKNKGNKNKKNK